MRLFAFLMRQGLPWCLVLLAACTDPYMPEVITSPPSYLVVDGFINLRGVTTIKLSRTYAVASLNSSPAETKATVSLEEENGVSYALREAPSGTYTSSALALNLAKKYRLRLRTQAGSEYTSDFVVAKATPPIDKVHWVADNAGLRILVDTHDATNNTRYYRWQCEETWETIPPYSPSLEYVNGVMRPIRTPYPSICWSNEKSPDIKLSKTTNLNQDVVSAFVLRTYPSTSERLHSRYSILVTQYAQTPEEYQYWELLRKNTESIGTLFDPLPVQLAGNVHCLNDPAAVALGYIGAYSVEQQRVFINRNELPGDWRVASGYDLCVADTVNYKVYRSVFSSSNNIPLYEVQTGYLGTSVGCVDCRLRGSAVKPSFW